MSTDIAALVKQSVVRELESLRDAVRDLAGPLDERRFWTMPLEPGNSFGHLVLHLTGNLNWFVGASWAGPDTSANGSENSPRPTPRPRRRRWPAWTRRWRPSAAWSRG